MAVKFSRAARSGRSPSRSTKAVKRSAKADSRRTLRDIFSLPSFDIAALRTKSRIAVTVLAWLLLVADVFLVASLFTSWTGVIGQSARAALLSRFGGGVLIVLCYLGYICVSIVSGKGIPQPVRQTVGTFFFYVCIALTLGLFELASPGFFSSRLLFPGSVGRDIALWCYRNIGPLGTSLAGICMVACTLACFGFTMPFPPAFGTLARVLAERAERKRGAHERDPLAAPADLDDDWGDDVRLDSDSPPPPDDEDEDEDFADVPDSDITYAVDSMDLPSPVEVVTVDELGAGEDAAAPMGQFPPPAEVYGPPQDDSDGISIEMARPWGERIIDSLAQFGIEAELADILLGPTVIQFRIQPLPGVKVNKIVALANDLAMALAVSSLRVEAPIPGHPYVGIEIPNPKRRGITLRSLVEEDAYQDTDKSLPLPMGVTINGDPLIVGLEELPHLLVAGTTGSGKSVFVNGCIVGLCSMRRPDELKMVLVDPKRVEMAVYEKLPHILTPPVTDPKKAVHVLGWAVREMERRYTLFAESRVRNLASYNEIVLPKDRLPHIVIVVDELADLMMTAAKEVEEYICRLAQMARATGIHLMLATQRPSVNVITGLIKANVPARVAFTLPSMMDSRTIIDTGGAEKLLGKGDMLFLSTQNPKPVRVQSPWIDERAIARWLDYLIHMFGEPDYTDIESQGEAPTGFEDGDGFDDALLGEAIHVVVTSGMASASGLQRRLRVGFTRAGRLVDMMERAGIVGPADGSRPREILVDEEEAEEIMTRLGIAE